jgi:GxxExxY protein
MERELKLPIEYKEIKLNYGYKIDFLIENQLEIEIKTVETFTDVHKAQILTYLRLGNYKTGLLINFNTKLLSKGIKRFIV